ncbi:hypothetical protein J2848_003827 [Azospirillum lipoferum]|uniref:DUF4297 domain-containing protein n=1 Tax=Azospirillum lipoferum TaxID=193 RepID=A0A5A9GDX9_AZOLI|nr:MULTISPECIES: dsDNA nuclease domain-containing protein [Azospirillum]KAA0591985.1 DUF4297 domain-containing protein [Azospirillum lipoferum]MCP1612147.1 hypothetical protein [Azospirillum lipoferum]MDW5536630.1 dsDNA nuclease domain-containing protein [Azospirillum sp. NL1]
MPKTETSPGDVGSATSRRYEYQYAYGAALIIYAVRGDSDYVALRCEGRSDIEAVLADRRFDLYEIKTKESDDYWRVNDDPITNTMRNFCLSHEELSGGIRYFYIVSDLQFSSKKKRLKGSTPSCNDFFRSFHNCAALSELSEYFLQQFTIMAEKCGVSRDLLFRTLAKTHLVKGPDQRGYVDALVCELATLKPFEFFYRAQLEQIANGLIARVREASIRASSAEQRFFAEINGKRSKDACSELRINETFLNEMQSALNSFPPKKGISKSAFLAKRSMKLHLKEAFVSFFLPLGFFFFSTIVSIIFHYYGWTIEESMRVGTFIFICLLLGGYAIFRTVWYFVSGIAMSIIEFLPYTKTPGATHVSIGTVHNSLMNATPNIVDSANAIIAIHLSSAAEHIDGGFHDFDLAAIVDFGGASDAGGDSSEGSGGHGGDGGGGGGDGSG